MTWTVEFHPLVLEQDLPAIDGSVRNKILKAIREKLTAAPESYGERLRAELHGYWKLRVGDYRVVYEVRRDRVIVLVLKIGYRRDGEVYKQMPKRLSRRQPR